MRSISTTGEVSKWEDEGRNRNLVIFEKSCVDLAYEQKWMVCARYFLFSLIYTILRLSKFWLYSIIKYYIFMFNKFAFYERGATGMGVKGKTH